MAERPILFSGPMVRAILAGRKTQTRRVLKCQPGPDTSKVFTEIVFGRLTATFHPYEHTNKNSTVRWGLCHCPYGQPGDRLWVRETWRPKTWSDSNFGEIEYADKVVRMVNGPWSFNKMFPVGKNADRWRPSIHMPRWASRITLEITDIRVERVHEISRDDCEAEGSYWATDADDEGGFVNLWDSINAKRGYGWDANPWVWVISFKKLETADRG
jgi:hypothetical protein